MKPKQKEFTQNFKYLATSPFTFLGRKKLHLRLNTFFIILFCVFVFCLNVCVCVCRETCLSGVHRGQKKVSDPLERSYRWL